MDPQSSGYSNVADDSNLILTSINDTIVPIPSSYQVTIRCPETPDAWHNFRCKIYISPYARGRYNGSVSDMKFKGASRLVPTLSGLESSQVSHEASRVSRTDALDFESLVKSSVISIENRPERPILPAENIPENYSMIHDSLVKAEVVYLRNKASEVYSRLSHEGQLPLTFDWECVTLEQACQAYSFDPKYGPIWD